jgi:hypothetical protein
MVEAVRANPAPAHANRDTARRVVPLFRPYRAQVAAVVALIVVTSSIGAVLAEQHDEWTEMRRYIGLDILAKSRLTIIENTEPEEVTLTAITA